MKCPQCDSDSVQTTCQFDGTVIEPTECIHDFECSDCGCLFQIVYTPIETRIHQRGDLSEKDET